jgi:hypothetical protein
MPEPQKVVHLTSAQRRRKKFKHPLMTDAPRPLNAECLDQLLLEYFGLTENSGRWIEIGQKLVVNYFCLLGGVIARYLYHWPVSRRFLDEMVSTGAETVTRIIADLKSEKLCEGDWFISLGGLIESRIRFDIEDTINKFRGVVPASRGTNKNQERGGQRPIYGTAETSLTSEKVKNSHRYEDLGCLTLEIQDTLRAVAKTDIEMQVLSIESWRLSNAELAKKLGRTERRILEIRSCLRERYDRLIKRTI